MPVNITQSPIKVKKNIQRKVRRRNIDSAQEKTANYFIEAAKK